MEEHQIFQQKSTANTRVSHENMYSRISLANTNAIRNKCYTHIRVLKTFMHKVITITGKQGPLLLPRSFNMKTIAQDLVRMLSFKSLYKATELTVGKVTYTTTLLSRPDGKIDLR